MPPKKRVRRASRAASTVSHETPVATPAAPSESPIKPEVFQHALDLSDPWSDEQEISLFKAMIKWKPVGMHKHFRMLSIAQHMRSHGHDPKREPHTSISGIWGKLGSLYNLRILDEREDNYGEAIPDANDPASEPFVPFKLPRDEYGGTMHERRLAPEGSSSPPALEHQLSTESHEGFTRRSTIEDSEEPRSSPASVRGAKATRGRRGGRRSTLLQEEATPKARSTSKTTEASGDGGEQEEEDEEDDNEDTGGNESEAATLRSRVTSKPGRGRGRPRAGGGSVRRRR